LAKDAIQIDRPRLTDIHKRSEKYLKECISFLSENEYLYIKTTIANKSISTPKILIKDHKDKQDNDTFPLI
jgi:hypothetical protein